jgi:lipopolysaccharide transport system permease protein
MSDELMIIETGRSNRHCWLDLWRYRELVRLLAWRDLSVGYKQTVIGALRALIRRLLTAAVFTVIFSRITKLPADGNGVSRTNGVRRTLTVDALCYRVQRGLQ